MPNPQIAALISEHLIKGLIHPGDPDDNRPPAPIVLPPFRTVGMEPQMRELAEKTADLLAEAIVHLIETEGNTDLISREEQARAIATARPVEPARTVALHCRCDSSFTNPLAILTVTDSPHVVINGKQLIQGLTAREAACPHKAVA